MGRGTSLAGVQKVRRGKLLAADKQKRVFSDHYIMSISSVQERGRAKEINTIDSIYRIKIVFSAQRYTQYRSGS